MKNGLALFLVSIVLWALVGRAALAANIAHPMAVGVVWLIGFVWIAGYTAAGPRSADQLVKVWLGSMAGSVAIAVFLTMALS